VIINELMNYTADDNGKTNASVGYNDDTVIATAIALEVIRTHGDKLTNNTVPFTQRIGNFQAITTNWL